MPEHDYVDMAAIAAKRANQLRARAKAVGGNAAFDLRQRANAQALFARQCQEKAKETSK